MFRKSISIVISLLICFVILPSIFASSDPSTLSMWRYKLVKFVEEEVSVSFTSNEGIQIAEKSLNMEATLSSSQINLHVRTNAVNPYSLKLTFSLLRQTNAQTGEVLLGYYDARVIDVPTYPDPETGTNYDYMDIVFNSTSNVWVEFRGENSYDAGTYITVDYPISFDLTKYVDSYSAGTYTGTIQVEVISL